MSSLLELAFFTALLTLSGSSRHRRCNMRAAAAAIWRKYCQKFFLPQCLPSAEAHILYYSQPESYKIILHFLRGRIGLWIGPRGTHTSLVLFFKAKVWKWRKERGRLIFCKLSCSKVKGIFNMQLCTFLNISCDSKFQWSSGEIYVMWTNSTKFSSVLQIFCDHKTFGNLCWRVGPSRGFSTYLFMHQET